MGRKRRKSKNNCINNKINNIDKSVNEIKNKMNNKTVYAKISKIISLITTVFTIFGFSIFGGKALLNNTQETIKEEKYHKGTITKTGWESKFIGLRYTNPEGMRMATEEELDAKNILERGTSSIVFDQSEIGYAELTTEYEMVSSTDDKSIITGVCVERMIEKVDIFQFIEEFKSLIYRNPFVNYTLISDDETMKIGNEDYIMVSYMIESNNVFRYQDSYFRVVGDRVIMISFNYNDERERDNVLNAFTAY